MPKKLTIALAGNPNSGKTTIFNNLTGARQHVGNYPGVTVEKKEGNLKYRDYQIDVVDLPGTYSLTAHSLDELVARNFIIETKPDVVIDIIDASNLERNLYLATQLIELSVPLVLAFNMTDLANQQGFLIDREKLSVLLGTPIVLTVATKGQGMDQLLDQAIKVAEGKTELKGTLVRYGQEVQEELTKLEDILIKDQNLSPRHSSRWLAVKLLENDNEVTKQAEQSPYASEILSQQIKSIQHLKKIFADQPEAIIADRRYGFISGACSEAIQRTIDVRHSTSDKIDEIIVNKILGLPIFLGLMWLVFKFTFTLSAPFMNLIEKLQAWLGNSLSAILPESSLIQSLVVEGIVGGVGSVLVFVPVIFLLFLALSALEDSGYMARAAFIMDRLMHRIGLHGRSFIPMLLGFGCNMPAIMATRTIEDRRDRLVTILIIPFMSCGARLPVYTLLIGAFFSETVSGNVLFSLYLLGIMVAIIMARLFRKYLFRGEAAPFVMELPPYRLPTIKGLLIHMWQRGVIYLKKAGTVIFAGSVLVWALSTFPLNQDQSESPAQRLEKSYAGRLGKAVAPVFKPLGFDDWKLSVGLVEGLVAKEIVVSALGTLHAADEQSQDLRQALRSQVRPDGSKVYSPLAAYSLMVFILLYMPCLA
ncbi:MAG: ferrous iron transport protein B, partial [Candidatus Omnitrophica bacterium]|nr:ferrous iron transport protein B [Candidatus Omnitrophota bacterium]